MPEPTQEQIYDAACRYVDAGLCVMPLKEDKHPALDTWKFLQERRPTLEELHEWFLDKEFFGLSVLGGPSSGNLEILDIEGRAAHLLFQLRDLLNECASGLWERFSIFKTPSGGYHVPWRCEQIEGSLKLAYRPALDENGEPILDEHGKQKKELLIEMKGSGGYVATFLSSGRVHETGLHYEPLTGDWLEVPTISIEERELILTICRSFNEVIPEPVYEYQPSSKKQSGTRPGDDFNARATWAEVLEPYGWKAVKQHGGKTYWRKPGSRDPYHANTNHGGSDFFYCFSTNCVFEDEKTYSKFSAFTLLNYGDLSEESFKKAAKELGEKGYGSQQPTADKSKKKADDDDEKSKVPTHDILRDRWRKAIPPTVYSMGGFWQYKDGLWHSKEEVIIKRQIQRVIEKAKKEGIRPTGGLLNSVYALAVAVCSISSERFNAQHQYLVCANGTLNLETRQLEKHNPNHCCTSGVAYNYDPEATAPAWLAFLDSLIERANAEAKVKRKDVAGIELVEFLQEFAGLALTTDNSYEIALWLHGFGGTGKSTYIEGLMAAMGDRQIEIGLANLEQSRFSLGELPGKTLAFATEQPGDFVRSTDLLIKLISGEMITIEKKFAHPYSIRSTVKLVWAMNDLPRISSPNSGLFRRVKVVKWPKLDPADVNPTVKEQIKKEGQGILNWALDGLYRLRQRGMFCIPNEVQQASLEFRAANDVPASFLAECCNVDTTGRSDFKEPSKELYRAYKDWCLENGHKPKSITAIAEDWKRLGLENRSSGGYPYWHGVELR